MHLVNDENTTGNRLHLFNLESIDNHLELDFNVAQANVISPSELLIVERLPGNSSFGLHILDFEIMETRYIGSMNTSNVYLDKATDTLYVNDSVTYDSETKEIIYTIKLDSLKRR